MARRIFWVHGSGYTQDSFREQVAAFPDSDAVSLPGHPHGDPLTTIGDMAEWLGKYIRWAGKGPAIVGGNSLGGAIAMEWALRFPDDAAGLILIGTGARGRVSPPLVDNEWPASIPKLVDFALSANASHELRRRAEEWHHTVGQKATRADYAACNVFDEMDRLPDIHVPTLIVVGGEDRLTLPKFSRYLHEHIAGSELLEVPGAGHVVMAERSDVVNPTIEAFVASIAE
jgi:pimeloyl-ACP methyl ester carboxylesterase